MDLYSFILEEILDQEENSAKSISLAILRSEALSTGAKTRTLIHFLLKITRIRKNAITIIAKSLLIMNTTLDCKNFKELFLHESTKLLTDNTTLLFNHSHFKLLRECIKTGFLTKREVDEKIIHRLNQKRRPHLLIAEYFFSFLDILSDINPELFLQIKNKVVKWTREKKELPDLFGSSLDYIAKNSFSESGILDTEYDYNSVEYAIINDNVQLCMERIERYGCSIDTIVPPNAFGKKPDCLHTLTYVSLAALYGSIRCFKSLILQDAKFGMPDNSPSIENIAIAGGNLEIIRILSQNKECNFTNACEYATLYCQRDILKWLLYSHGSIPTKKSIENAFILDDIESVKIIFEACYSLGMVPQEKLPFSYLTNGLPLSVAASRNNAVKCLLFLKERGEDLSWLNHAVFSPLTAALSTASLEAADILVAAGATLEKSIVWAAQSDCVYAIEWVISREEPQNADIVSAYNESVFLVNLDSVAFIEEHYPDIIKIGIK